MKRKPKKKSVVERVEEEDRGAPRREDDSSKGGVVYLLRWVIVGLAGCLLLSIAISPPLPPSRPSNHSPLPAGPGAKAYRPAALPGMQGGRGGR